MTIEMKTRNNDKKTNETVAERLPTLSDDDVAIARGHLRWTGWYIGAEKGRIVPENYGINLQVVGTRAVRFLTVYDHPECYLVLAKMLHSFHEAGVEAEVDPYAVIADIPSGEPEGEAKSDEEDVGVV